MKLISIEDQIIKATIQALLDAGYMLSVDDGGEEVIVRSMDSDAIFAVMKTTDQDFIYVWSTEGRCGGWVRFVYGNDDTDVINDHTLGLDPQMNEITKMINEYEAK